jgi:hypothetical protein
VKIILKQTGKISNYLIKMGILDFENAEKYIKKLPYKRNVNKENIFCVLEEGGGTCSTKHALLKRLADENNYEGVKLMLGIFKMNAVNTPKIAAVLQKYHLNEIPEAHNYLKFKNKIKDFTTKNSEPEDFVNDLVEEIEIQTNQISHFKVKYHTNFLENYLLNNPQIKYSPSEFWQIREECIAALQH